MNRVSALKQNAEIAEQPNTQLQWRKVCLHSPMRKIIMAMLLLAGTLSAQEDFRTAKDESVVIINDVFHLITEYKSVSYHDSVSARHILIGIPNPSDTLSAYNRADSILTVINEQGNFDEMVVLFSEDPGSKHTGGLYEWFPRGVMVAPFEKAAFEGEIGVPEIVRTQFGYHIVEPTAKSESMTEERTFITVSAENYSGKIKGYQRGMLTSEGTVKDGIRHGNWINYFPGGQVAVTQKYVAGELNGPYKEWDANGNLITEATYKNDLPFGSFVTYFADGTIESKATYTQETVATIKTFEQIDIGRYTSAPESPVSIYVSIGDFESYFESGTLSMTGRTINGTFDGPVTTYYDNGQMKAVFIFKDDMLSHVTEMYSQTGTELDPGTFMDGTGSVHIYDDDGVLQSTEHYENWMPVQN